MPDDSADERRRVVLLAKGLGPGGMERLAVAQVRFGDEARFDYSVAYLRPDKDQLVGEAEAAGARCTCLATSPADPRWPLRLRALVSRDGIDVVHVHSPALAPAVRVAVRTMRARPRVVYTEHNQWAAYHPVTRWANRLTFGLDDAHVAVSASVRASVSARYRRGLPVLIHGIDVEQVAAARSTRAGVRAELGLTEDDVVIGAVANLRREKGHQDLLAAAVQVTSARPRARFIVAGQGPLEAELRAEVATLGLTGHVTYLGFRADAWRVMSAFDIFVLASRFEGLPVALMEARALGLPVVATRAGGLAEHVVDGVDGVLVAPQRPEELAAGLVALIDDPAQRARLAQQSAARADEYDVRRAARAVEALYG